MSKIQDHLLSDVSNLPANNINNNSRPLSHPSPLTHVPSRTRPLSHPSSLTHVPSLKSADVSRSETAVVCSISGNVRDRPPEEAGLGGVGQRAAGPHGRAEEKREGGQVQRHQVKERARA